MNLEIVFMAISMRISDFLKVAHPKRRLPMDMSVISIESLAMNFSQTLSARGFYKGSLRHFSPYQSSGVLQINREVIGLVLLGELLVEFSDSQRIIEIGTEFFLPPNVYFQATAGEHGAHFLFARKRMHLDS
jgi:hypothetical protein